MKLELSKKDGRLLAAYVTVRDGEHHETREVIAGEVLIDFDEDGRVLGIEILHGDGFETPLAPAQTAKGE